MELPLRLQGKYSSRNSLSLLPSIRAFWNSVREMRSTRVLFPLSFLPNTTFIPSLNVIFLSRTPANCVQDIFFIFILFSLPERFQHFIGQLRFLRVVQQRGEKSGGERGFREFRADEFRGNKLAECAVAVSTLDKSGQPFFDDIVPVPVFLETYRAGKHKVYHAFIADPG